MEIKLNLDNRRKNKEIDEFDFMQGNQNFSFLVSLYENGEFKELTDVDPLPTVRVYSKVKKEFHEIKPDDTDYADTVSITNGKLLIKENPKLVDFADQVELLIKFDEVYTYKALYTLIPNGTHNRLPLVTESTTDPTNGLYANKDLKNVSQEDKDSFIDSSLVLQDIDIAISKAINSVNGVVVDPEDETKSIVIDGNTIYVDSEVSDTELVTINEAINDLPYYGGEVSETEINIYMRRIKTDIELIELFGVVSENLITVEQTEVNYSEIGTYPVTFIFSVGKPITCKINIVPLLVFDALDLKRYTRDLNNTLNFFTIYDKQVSFSNPMVILNGADDPTTINGNLYLWENLPSDNIDKVEILFENVSTINNGKKLSCKVSFINKDIYPYVDTYQKWGFNVVNGRFIPMQAGFVNLEPLFQFYDEDGNIIAMDIAVRVDNVNYAKHVGSEVGVTEFFVSSDTLLLGEEFNHPNTSIPVFIASRYEGDGDTPNADNIALGIVKRNTSSFTIVFGKNYTGDINYDHALTPYLELPITIRYKEIIVETQDEPIQFIHSKSNTPVNIAVNSFQILKVFPVGTFKDNTSYEIKANAKYLRSSGNSNLSNIGFRLVQGIKNIFDGEVTVFRDTVKSTLGVPQLEDVYNLNSTEAVTLQAYINDGEQPVTITDFAISFKEIRNFVKTEI